MKGTDIFDVRIETLRPKRSIVCGGVLSPGPDLAQEMATTENKLLINRAPVLTLWGIRCGRAVGVQSQGGIIAWKRLGWIDGAESERGGEFWVELLGRALAAVNTEKGVRAVVKSKPIEPGGVERYLERNFGDAAPGVRKIMKELATAFDTEELPQWGFRLYEQCRPKIPEGELDLGRIRRLALEK